MEKNVAFFLEVEVNRVGLWLGDTGELQGRTGERGKNDLFRANRKSEETRNVRVRNVFILLRNYTGVVTQNIAFRVFTDLKT